MIRRTLINLIIRATEPPPERARVIRLEAQNAELRRENADLLRHASIAGHRAAESQYQLDAQLKTANAKIAELSDLAAKLDARVGELTAPLDGERWIPCAERMPAAGVPVLIATIDDQTIMGAFFETGTVFRAAWGDGSIGVLAIDLSRAWRPIPTYTPPAKP